jgi:SAM-dependent methyltransferase
MGLRSKRLGITGAVKRLIKRGECGGVRWAERSLQDNVSHVLAIAEIIGTHMGDIRGQVGAELGPGDNLGVTYTMLKAGARRMYAVEKYRSVAADAWCAQVFRSIDRASPASAPIVTDVLPTAGGTFNRLLLRLEQTSFESFKPDDPIDFVFSHDVLEHVDPRQVLCRAFEILRPGGQFVNVVDLTGHGVFYDLKRPLDFLTCPDWLWRLMFSEMETTNRVRFSEFLVHARQAGFEISEASAIRRADPVYLKRIRPHLLPRYQQLADRDLSVMQCVMKLRKPL